MTFGDQMLFPWAEPDRKAREKPRPMSKGVKVAIGAAIGFTALGGLVSLLDALNERERNRGRS